MESELLWPPIFLSDQQGMTPAGMEASAGFPECSRGDDGESY
ncbi:MAG: hypothetical protein OEZ48_16520 [Candidatus Bathyarchaeota archaeon]|nr:hypothetical protein [Candidatus Bathyarchaeota archaeon]